jgi:hypothetical protein
MNETPPVYRVLRCDCGANVVVGPVEGFGGRKIFCSACRAERVETAARQNGETQAAS